MSKKGKKERKAPPVPTGHDDRAEERSEKKCVFDRESDAPDGVSGNWS